MTAWARLARVSHRRAVHLFAASNVAFLGVDIVVAHMTNAFAERTEWAPIVFSAIATLLLLPSAVGVEHRAARVIDLFVGWGSVVVGVVGIVLHLGSAFFLEQTLHNLVYSAPFVAPLSYVGVGLLFLLLRSPEAETADFGTWVLVLALGGFLGNFALSLLDHAQNAFFHVTEWIPVAAAAVAIGLLVVAIARPASVSARVFLAAMGVQVLVGVLGFGLHVAANIERQAASFVDRFVFGAPAFAPLLFADLALLAVLGHRATRASRSAQV